MIKFLNIFKQDKNIFNENIRDIMRVIKKMNSLMEKV